MDYVGLLTDRMAEILNYAQNAGKAKSAIWLGNNSVQVNGQIMNAKVICPITPLTGQTVYVQISTGDNVAYVVG